MIKQSINNEWQLSYQGNTYKGNVPVSVLGLLSDNGAIPDPYYSNNEDIIRPVLEQRHTFVNTFAADEGLFDSDQILLRFNGIDTEANIYLNDKCIGFVNNMHRTYDFDVTDILVKGENILKLDFESSFAMADREWEKCPTRGTEDAWEGFSNIRKAHYMYGWDWGAHLPDMGIWRDVTLLGIKTGMIDCFSVSQKHAGGKVKLTIEPELKLVLGTDSITYVNYEVADNDGEIVYSGSSKEITIENPKLWWPNGLGEQPLYTVTVCLNDEYGNIIDVKSEKIGLRTLSVRKEKDEAGESFEQNVNGVSFFAMGGDYIPEEHIISRKTREKTRQLLEDSKLANFNSIRVWGGGYYPDDYFFELCDELGLVVWEDFMFACSTYELTEEFEENITAEIIDNLKRIRNHASLGIICGNNEMESFVKDGVWVSKPSEVKDYLLMNERIIPALCKKYAPDIFYWPSSPSSGGSFDAPQDPNRGDVHFWDVWHSSKPFTEYRAHRFRYLSEFGFQSLPAYKTFTDGITDKEEELNLFSYTVEKHQRNQAANGKIMLYLQKTYLYPNSFSDMVYASQLLAGDGIRYGVEHFRRNRGVCMGAVYWQLNDCWPVISWSSIDYYGRWKALHYYAKRFFEPVHISCEEEGWISAAQPDFNRKGFDNMKKSIRLNVTNESFSAIDGTVNWQRRDASGNIIEAHSEKVKVEPFSALWLDKKEFGTEFDLREHYIYFELVDNTTGAIISSGSVILGLPKYFKYEDPKLTAKVIGDEIHITSNAYAASVEILNENEDLVLSDNYFDMNPGTKVVKILRGNADKLRLRCVRDIGR